MSSRLALHVEHDYEIALALVLEALDGVGTPYDPPFSAHGLDLVRAARASGRGTLIVGVHQYLGLVLPRLLEDEGIGAQYILGTDRFRIPGTRRFIAPLQPGPSMLLRARSALEEAETVWALIDRRRPERRTVSIGGPHGEIHLSTALVSIAAACSASIILMLTHLDDSGRISARFCPVEDVRANSTVNSAMAALADTLVAGLAALA